MSAVASQITGVSIVYLNVCSKKCSKIGVTDLCEGNSPVTGEFPAQIASNAGNVSIWWRYHVENVKLRQKSVQVSSWISRGENVATFIQNNL